MLVIPAYYDGSTVKTVTNYKFSKNQKLMITVLDESEEKKMSGIKSLRGSLSKYANPNLIKNEKAAWGNTVGEKHGLR
ncbi:MAG: hypothetical protein J5747_00280 [Spirochaetaceae bacterium]|nr:hypothetical protein [Spirochaetaceae bacterium]